MPIRWSPVKVADAASMIEKYIQEAAGPLEQARIVAQEARRIANLPQYVYADFMRLEMEISRAIGGSQWSPKGRLNDCVESIRKSIPGDAIQREQDKLKTGSTQSLL
jgi:hypothetical protein